MKELHLGKGQVCLVSDEDFELAARFLWRVRRGYAVVPTLALHRLVAGAPPGWRVRHRNGNKLDNRRENLEVVPPGEVRPTAG